MAYTSPKTGKNVETHRVAGTSYKQREIKSLGSLNPDYQLNKAQLIKKGLLNTSVYEYTFKKLKAELIPEPTNEVDPNAIKVIVSGKHVGYIKKGSCAHIKKLLKSNTIVSVTANVKGGNYKYIQSFEPGDYAFESDKGEFGIDLTISMSESSVSLPKPPSAPGNNKQTEYEDLIKKKNLTKKKAQSCRTYSLIFSALFILIGLLTASYGWGWLFIILGILFACSAHFYKNLIKACFSSQNKKD